VSPQPHPFSEENPGDLVLNEDGSLHEGPSVDEVLDRHRRRMAAGDPPRLAERPVPVEPLARLVLLVKAWLGR
jgi:hypothetical protein